MLGTNILSNNFAIQKNSGDLDLGIEYRCLECSRLSHGTDLHRFSEGLDLDARYFVWVILLQALENMDCSV